MSDEQIERKNKRTAFLYTSAIQVVLFFLVFFIVGWKAPDPPLPEYGIELNFGLDNQGSGDIQPETPVGDGGREKEEPAKSKPQVQEETKVEEKAQEEVKPIETKPVESEITSKAESPVVVKEKKEEVKPVEKPVIKPEEKKVEPKVVEKPKVEEKKVEEKPKVIPDAVYKPKAQESGSGSQTAGSKEGAPGNHGDDVGKTGDKGSPQGTLDAKALYGKPGGGGGGSSLELAGWNWDEIPQPNVPNNITGRIVFEIQVDDKGELIRIDIVQNSLNPEATKACREAVQKLTFLKTGNNVPALSKGKITFVVRSN